MYRVKLQVDPGCTAPPPRGRPCGSWLGHPDPGAALAANLLDDEILAVAKDYLDDGAAHERGAIVFKTRERKVNLCGSQPMCFNLFAHWRRDLDLATHHARGLWPKRIERVVAVHFEHSPGRWNRRFLNNGSAFDLALAHTTPSGGKGLIGIETKYFEDMRDPPPSWKARYRAVGDGAMCFKSTNIQRDLWRAPVWQLWLDHLRTRPHQRRRSGRH